MTNYKYLISNKISKSKIQIANSKQIKALDRLLFHHLYLEFICSLGFVFVIL